MPKPLIPTAVAAQLLGVSVRSLLALSKRGAVPAPIRLGERVLRWDQTAIEQRIKSGT
jgi:predicted DNA-binding transcriptional regulator AlpA